jgi:predicted anti-sigma-YlaC factor YlaD
MDRCEEMAERLSAWLDGELEAEEESLLMEHLQACPDCRKRSAGFEAVNQLLTPSNALPRPGFEKRLEGELFRKPAVRRFVDLGRVLRVAAAALVLIAVSLLILVTGDRADAKRAAAHAVALQRMNQEAAIDQEAELDTFRWDLKAMKLKVKSLELDANRSEVLLERIDDLLTEVEKVRMQGHQE